MKKNVCSCGYDGNEWMLAYFKGWGHHGSVSCEMHAISSKDLGDFMYEVKECSDFIVCPICGLVKADITKFGVREEERLTFDEALRRQFRIR